MNDDLYNPYETPITNTYAQKSVASPTLALISGIETNTVEEESNNQIINTPAFVAGERARAIREENLRLTKESGVAFAQQGNSAAVEETLRQIQEQSKPTENSFHDDTQAIAQAALERAMLANPGKTVDEIINMADKYANAMATRSALEVVTTSLDTRSSLMQFGQDVLGITTVKEWGAAVPVVNELNEQLGFKGSRALTTSSAAYNFYTTLRLVDEKDRPKVIKTFTDRLVSTVGEETTKRILIAVQNVASTDPALEGTLGMIDVLGITALVKGAGRAVLGASRGIAVARSVGAEVAAARDLATTLAQGKGTFGASTTEAAEASLNAKIIPTELDGLGGSVQRELENRVAALLKDLDTSLYGGGANKEEILASKKRLEAIYSNSSNPSIIKSEIDTLFEQGRLSLNVLYGNASGKMFDTAEDALAYWKDWKAGKLEVVPVLGDVAPKIAELDATIAKLTKEIGEMRKSSVDGVAEQFGLYEYPAGVRVSREGSARTASEAHPTVLQVWEQFKSIANPLEKAAVENALKSIPKNTKVVAHKGTGRAYYQPATDTIHIYSGSNDGVNVFTHELMHGVTAHRIKYGVDNPNTAIGKAVTEMEALRVAVRSNINKLKGDESFKQNLLYLTSNLDEFSTAALWQVFGTPRVAAWMSTIPYKNSNMLSELWTAFKEILGFRKDDTALAEWFNITEKLTKEGLVVKLPDEVSYVPPSGKRKVFATNDKERVYPGRGAPADKMDTSALDKLEEAVAMKVALEMGPPKPGFYVRQKTTVPVFTADIGNITLEELEKMHLNLGKLNPRLASANSIYTPALIAGFKKSKLGKGFAEFITKSFDKLNKDSIDKVNKALVNTEKLKRDMSSIELDGIGVRSLEEKEAYYAFRTMRNIQFQYKEQGMRDAFMASGHKNVFVGLDELGTLSGPAKVRPLSELLGKRVFNAETRGFVTITQENLKEFGARGLVSYEYAKGQSLTGITSPVKTVMVHPTKLREGDVMSVVGRVDGAYSRIYEEEFFININGKQLIDDVLTDSSYAFRTAATEKDANAYITGLNNLIKQGRVSEADVTKQLGIFEQDAAALATRINEGKFRDAVATVKYDRLEGNYFRNVMGVGTDDKSGGRVFWSDRSEEGLRSISTGSTENITKGPLDSLQAEIANTSNFVSMGEWRRNSIQRWFNTFEDVIDNADKLGAKTAEDVFFNVVNRAQSAAFDDPQLRRMLAVKDFIISQLGVQTSDEMAVQNVVRRLTNSTNIPGFGHVGKLVRKYDVPAYLKSVNSTLMLGLFSASQLVVQSSGMALAASISPRHGLQAAYSIRPILGALTSDNSKVWEWFHKSMDVVQLTGTRKEEFVRIAAAIKKSGLLDNIGASSIYNNSDGALNIFQKHQRKFNNYQMGFFNTGEEINRVGAFEIARREFIAANPETLWDSNDALHLIMQRADDLTMNMTRVNEARMTQGWYGIPLQFLQHNIRLGTNIIAAGFGQKSPTLSTNETYKLVLGSYLLYGVNNNGTPDFIEEALGNALNSSATPEQKQYLTQGLLAGILGTLGEAVTGERVQIAVGSRLSSLQWYEDVYKSITDLMHGEDFDSGTVFGPTGSSLMAAVEAPKALWRYVQKDEWQGADFLRTLSTIGSSLSTTWRNADKAYWAWHANGMLMNKKGDVTAQLSTPEIFIQALGFSSTESIEAGSLFRTETDYRHTMTSYANSILAYNKLAMQAYLAGDTNAEDVNYAAASAILAPLPYADQQYINKLIKDRTTYDTTLNEAMNKWWNKMSSRKNKFLVNNNFEEADGN